ncbi:hypothetical protein BJ912DRAFT_1109121 [Pholiota molesta]|nr:hypothetical protein BJ912DRAFT_1109121 [Pholiota molesta]
MRKTVQRSEPKSWVECARRGTSSTIQRRNESFVSSFNNLQVWMMQTPELITSGRSHLVQANAKGVGSAQTLSQARVEIIDWAVVSIEDELTEEFEYQIPRKRGRRRRSGGSYCFDKDVLSADSVVWRRPLLHTLQPKSAGCLRRHANSGHSSTPLPIVKLCQPSTSRLPFLLIEDPAAVLRREHAHQRTRRCDPLVAHLDDCERADVVGGRVAMIVLALRQGHQGGGAYTQVRRIVIVIVNPRPPFGTLYQRLTLPDLMCSLISAFKTLYHQRLTLIESTRYKADLDAKQAKRDAERAEKRKKEKDNSTMVAPEPKSQADIEVGQISKRTSLEERDAREGEGDMPIQFHEKKTHFTAIRRAAICALIFSSLHRHFNLLLAPCPLCPSSPSRGSPTLATPQIPPQLPRNTASPASEPQPKRHAPADQVRRRLRLAVDTPLQNPHRRDHYISLRGLVPGVLHLRAGDRDSGPEVDRGAAVTASGAPGRRSLARSIHALRKPAAFAFVVCCARLRCSLLFNFSANTTAYGARSHQRGE